MSETPLKLTPMYEQYLGIKANYPDALLFYRMGDFYELFFEDAVIGAKELQLTLTSRSRDAQNSVPMCGVPWHAAQNYIAQLIDKGFTVAICEQTENSKETKGLVARAVTRIITPGTVLEDINLDTKTHNYLASLIYLPDKGQGALAWADISTGQWTGITTKQETELWQWVQKLRPRELLISNQQKIPQQIQLENIHIVNCIPQDFDLSQAREKLLKTQNVQDEAALGLQNKPELIRACGALLKYIEKTQTNASEHLLPFSPIDLSHRLIIDELTEKNLEIFVRFDGQKGIGTLRHLLDMTMTPMGGRLLEDILHHPFRDLQIIEKIQKVVQFFFENDTFRLECRDYLKSIYDIERLSTRIVLNTSTLKDLIALRNSIEILPKLQLCIEKQNNLPETFKQLFASWDNLSDCYKILESALNDPPPTTITDGGIFKQGYNSDLDKLLDLLNHSEQKLQEMLDIEQKRTGISKLKIGYNRVFGYYFEMPRSQDKNIPDHFIRRQSLANNERFTTEQLKELEEALLSASDKRNQLEYNLFHELRQFISQQQNRLTKISNIISKIDFWQTLAEVARKYNWCKPTLTNELNLDIKDGRHPVVEKLIGTGNFIPNSINLNKIKYLCLLTGPNMAGKSTILRQTAIICLLAQMGSFVPASSATIGIVDRIFSRVGASDNLARGQSTFMVEMMETARILRQASKRSLVILDEIGRGTSTYDGLSLAWAIVEDLSKKSQEGLRTLFATHYHELTVLENKVKGVFTMNIAISEYNNEIIFLHKLIPGPSDRSYGVEVAKLAGIPNNVVQRAKQILRELESDKSEKSAHFTFQTLTLPGLEKQKNEKKEVNEFSKHPIIEEIQGLNINEITPLQAHTYLVKWKNLCKKS